jgi:hypothetical protein
VPLIEKRLRITDLTNITYLRDSDHVNDEVIVKEFFDVIKVSHEMNVVIDPSENGTQIGQRKINQSRFN